MKRRLTPFLLTIFASLALFGLIPATPVSAAAECFIDSATSGDAPFKSVSCEQIKALIELRYGNVDQNTCYLQNGSGWGMKAKAAAGSEECNGWRARAGETANLPPQCWVMNVTGDQYRQGEADPGDYSRVDCANHGLTLASTVEMSPGSCYLFLKTDQPGVYAPWFASCATVFKNTQAHANQPADQGEVSVSEDRNKISNCGEKGETPAECLKINPIVKLIDFAVNILMAVAGVAIVAIIVVAGIQYSTAGASPQAIEAAKSKIISALVALLALIFVYSFLQWLIPGGIF